MTGVSPTTPTDGYLLMVPIKSTSRGKSRLGLDAALRRRLALAMAMDTVAAASAAEPGCGPCWPWSRMTLTVRQWPRSALWFIGWRLSASTVPSLRV